MKTLSKEERKNRILAKGETSNHSHILTGDAIVERNENGDIMFKVGDEGAILRHLLEDLYVEEGKEVWTGEHMDINIPRGEYKYSPQVEFNPHTQRVQRSED